MAVHTCGGRSLSCVGGIGEVWRRVPTIACYCQDFPKPDMQHVHLQIMSLSRWQPAVIMQKRENADRFPFPQEKKRLAVLPRLKWRHANYLRIAVKFPPSNRP